MQDLAGPAAARLLGASVRHRRTRPRHLRPHGLRRAHHADHRRPGQRSSWCRSASASACPPAISAASIDAVLMRVTDIFLAFPRLVLALAFVAALGPGHRERRHRHRADRLAALCAPRARRDADPPRTPTSSRRRELQGASHLRILLTPDRAAVPALGDHPPHAGHGRHHPHRRRPRLPRPGRAAADAGMGRDGRPPGGRCCSTSGGWRPSRASRSSSSASASTCSATACATCSDPRAA